MKRIKKNVQMHIDTLNRELEVFSTNKPRVVFSPVVNTEEDYTEGSLKFDTFTAFFRCHKGYSGYSFMELPKTQDTDSPIDITEVTYEVLFKFDFSEIPFSAYDIHNAVNDSCFRTLCFHDITKEEEAVHAVSEMLNFITENENAISEIASNTAVQKLLIDNYFHDEKVFDKHFDAEEFNRDIKTNSELHEFVMSLHEEIEDGVYALLLTGNSKKLVKSFNKAQAKNKLIVFEKRYEKHLWENGFQNTNESASQRIKNKKNGTVITPVLTVILLIFSGVLSIMLNSALSNAVVSHYYPDALFLGTTSIEINIIISVISLLLILTPLLYKIPTLKNKLKRRLFSSDKYDKLFIATGCILLAVSVFTTVNAYKNDTIVIKENTLYIHNEAVDPQTSNIEFIYIKGYEYIDFDDNVIYDDSSVNCRSLMYVFDGEYENYVMCELLTEDNKVTNKVISQIQKAGCKISTYRTIEDFAKKNNFEIE